MPSPDESMLALARNTFLCLTFLLPLVLTGPDDVRPPGDGVESAAHQDSLVAAVRAAMAGMTTPELEQRKARRRLLQQNGYTSILSHTVRYDGLWALIEYSRVSLQLEYSLPRNTLFVYVPVRQPPESRREGSHFQTFRSGPMAVPLIEDRSFPEDPWKR